MPIGDSDANTGVDKAAAVYNLLVSRVAVLPPPGSATLFQVLVGQARQPNSSPPCCCCCCCCWLVHCSRAAVHLLHLLESGPGVGLMEVVLTCSCTSVRLTELPVFRLTFKSEMSSFNSPFNMFYTLLSISLLLYILLFVVWELENSKVCQ